MLASSTAILGNTNPTNLVTFFHALPPNYAQQRILLL